MVRIVSFTFAWILMVVGCNQNSSNLDQMQEEIVQALPGTYTGVMETAPSVMSEITHQFERIDAPKFGDHVLLYEITSTAENGPGKQSKIFVFEGRPDRQANTMSAYLLAPDQIPVGDTDDKWKTLKPSELRSFPDECDFRWSETEDGVAGIVDASDCIFPSQVFEGNIRSNMTYQISGDTLLWEEDLLTEDFQTIVSTNGLQTATRLNSSR